MFNINNYVQKQAVVSNFVKQYVKHEQFRNYSSEIKYRITLTFFYQVGEAPIFYRET